MGETGRMNRALMNSYLHSKPVNPYQDFEEQEEAKTGNSNEETAEEVLPDLSAQDQWDAFVKNGGEVQTQSPAQTQTKSPAQTQTKSPVQSPAAAPKPAPAPAPAAKKKFRWGWLNKLFGR